MDINIKQRFLDLWSLYFPGADLPIVFYYTDDPTGAELVAKARTHCFIDDLEQVRAGRSLCFDVKGIGCRGGRRYLGFSQTLRPNFEYFLSCGIPGELEGERYKKTPELVAEQMQYQPTFEAPCSYIIFKRWDMLDKRDEPLVAIFHAPPDVLAGLFTLVNFSFPTAHGVIAPFGSGCSSIVYYPLQERLSDRPRAVLGMFDVSARPYVPPGVLTFSVPMTMFVEMLVNANESFLITDSWAKIRERIEKSSA
jgi:hypothetical protein